MNNTPSTPIIALIGQPNVGKSTLFNIITKSQNALISQNNLSTTQNRKYFCTKYKNHKFIIIDTGGIKLKKKQCKMQSLITEQTIIAIKEATIILFIIDISSKTTIYDKYITKYLISNNKKTLLIVNKIDLIKNYHPNITHKFYSLKINEIFTISAKNKTGIKKIFEYLIYQKFFFNTKNKKNINYNNSHKKYFLKEKNICIKNKNIKKIAIIGNVNSGKSTLVNYITHNNRVITSNEPESTIDNIHIPATKNKRNYIIIDTAGININKNNYDHITVTAIKKQIYKAIKESEIIILIIDINEEINKKHLILSNKIINKGKILIFTINKCDTIKNEKQIQQKIIHYKRKIYNFFNICLISAINGQGINNLFRIIEQSYKNITKKTNTSKINNYLHQAIKKHNLLKKNKKTKLKYAHIGKHNPITIVIHGKKTKHLPTSYHKYLINFFHNKLKIKNAKITLKLKEIKKHNNFKKKIKILNLITMNKQIKITKKKKTINWKQYLQKEKTKPYFKNIIKTLIKEKKSGKIIYPNTRDIFNSIKYTKLHKIKIVIIGQDPYHQPNQANGFAFSVNKNTKIPPSLINIYKELHNNIPTFKIPNHGYLKKWALQGIMLLNSILTVEHGKANSHSNIGWEIFTDKIINIINTNLKNIIFMIWGNKAKKKIKIINNKKHHILKTSHPSPLSAKYGFLGCNHFKIANNILKKKQQKINWSLD